MTTSGDRRKRRFEQTTGECVAHNRNEEVRIHRVRSDSSGRIWRMTVAANNPRPRNRVLIILLVVIAVLVAALVGGELYVRNQVKTCMADQFQSELDPRSTSG